MRISSFHIFFAMLASLTMVACTKEPIACLTTDFTTANIEQVIQFNSCSTEETSLLWDFGDATAATGGDVSHAYNIPGTYTVTLTAKNSKSSTTVSKEIVIGSNWSVLEYPNMSMNFYSIDFVDTNTVFIAGEGGFIFKSTDAGLTWDGIGAYCGDTYDIEFTSPTTGYQVCSNGIIKTTDCGVTWTQVQTGQDGYYCIDFWDDNNGIAGSQGSVWKTTDAGATWTQHIVPGQFGLLDIHMTDLQTMHACGSDGKIARSTDGGLTWVTQSLGTQSIRDFSFVDANNGFAVGENYQFYRSSDAGQTWTEGSSYDQNAYGVYFSDEKNGYMGGYGGHIHRTFDGGNTWKKVRIGSAYQEIFAMEFIHPDLGIAVGRDGLILRLAR